MAVRTWVGRFAIVEGQPQEEGPYLRSFPRQQPDEEEDELYVLVEPATPGGEEYTKQLVDAIGRMYRQDSLSLTGALLRSLQAAHQELLQWNERSLREHRVGAGVSCLVVRGRTAYLAQVGPAVAFHVGDGRFRRIEPEEDAVEPLGQSEQVQPTFSRYHLSPGDLLLLASPRILELLDEDTLRSILLRGADEALTELYRLTREQQEFSMVLLACVIEPEIEAAPESVASAPKPAQPGEPPPQLEEESDLAELPSASAEQAPDDTTAILDLDTARPPAGLSQPKVRLKGDDANIRYPPTSGLLTALPRVPPLAIAGVLLLVAVGLLAWYLIPSTLQESRENRFAFLVADADTALNGAQAAVDPDTQRSLLQEASSNLAEAESIQSGEPQVAAMRSEVDAALIELDAVHELPPLNLVTDLSERVPGAFSSQVLALGGGGAYFLDHEQQRVVAVALVGSSPEPFVLFQAGDPVGAELAGVPQHIAWAEELSALLIMDDARRLISVRAGEARRGLAVRDAQAWGSADGIAYAEGNLYVLDREGNEVWRYLPGGSGFESEREPLLPPNDREEAVELAIGDAVYLVLADGSIQRFQSGTAQPVTLAGIDRPLMSPASLVPLSDSSRLLIADRGNRRIVVFTPDGVFRQQLVSATFQTDLRAVAVDERNNLLYILIGGALYQTALPPLPASP